MMREHRSVSETPFQDQQNREQKCFKRPYIPPKIIHEIELELRAGSPVPEFDDLLDLDKPGP